MSTFGEEFVNAQHDLVRDVQAMLKARWGANVNAYNILIAITALHSAAESLECALRVMSPDPAIIAILEQVRDLCAKHDREATANTVAQHAGGGAAAKGGKS